MSPARAEAAARLLRAAIALSRGMRVDRVPQATLHALTRELHEAVAAYEVAR